MIALIRKTVQSERTGHFNKTFRNNEIKSLISSRLVRISYSCKIRLKKILYVLCLQTLDKKKHITMLIIVLFLRVNFDSHVRAKTN